MAQTATIDTKRISFDWLCEYVARSWNELPALAAEWSEWDVDSRMDFLTDWPVTESYTSILFEREIALPSGDRRVKKVRALRALVERNRPILKYLDEHVLDK